VKVWPFTAGAGREAAASMRRLTTLLFSGSLISITIAAMITITSMLGAQQNSFERQTVVHRAEEIARMLIMSPSGDAESILSEAAEPDLTFKLERPSLARRRYLELTIAQYIHVPPNTRLGEPSDPPPDLAGAEYRGDVPLHIARDMLGLTYRHLAYVLEGTGQDFWRVSIPVRDGQWLSVEAHPTASVPQDLPRLGAILIAVTAVVAAGSIVALRRLTEPLRALENAAIQLGRDLDAPPLVERGPGDIRRVAHAFNRMQDQLRRFVSDRTTMLAAISHDLRSPLQRLKFRADFMEDGEQREKMLRDLRDMESMIAATLDFARADADREQAAEYDLSDMLNTIAEGLKELGYRVSIAAMPESLLYFCRGRALRRAIDNLAANAAIHGGVARLAMARGDSAIVITVEDDGPGLPVDALERVFTPFYRIDSARSRETGGAGLGLAIARSIVRSHGGDIVLINRESGGLTARLTLPV
jgi:signal transduction histidine kinase